MFHLNVYRMTDAVRFLSTICCQLISVGTRCTDVDNTVSIAVSSSVDNFCCYIISLLTRFFNFLLFHRIYHMYCAAKWFLSWTRRICET